LTAGRTHGSFSPFGRLAQLEEHLVYTQGVSGSNPLPPTYYFMAAVERIGEFLIRIKAMTPEQVQAVLHLQELGDRRRFGELALLLGYLKDDALKRYADYLDRQGTS
jgi:hypothetical protein